MPTYDYRCRKCGHRFELFHSIKDETAKRCPKCRGRAERVPASGAGILFRGSGFYITDYRSASYREKAKQEKSAESGGGSKPEGGGAKPEGGGSKTPGAARGKPKPKPSGSSAGG
jgi:putative FmdB family regulatory protein